MDLILKTATTGLNSDDVIIELAICDRNYTPLFNERFKPLRKRAWRGAERIHKISYHDVRNCGRFRDKVEEIKSILKDNRVIMFNADFDARLLEQTCKREKVDDAWVYEQDLHCCMYSAGSHYTNYANYYGGISLGIALELALQENKREHLNLKQPEAVDDIYSNESALNGCFRTAFIWNVIVEKAERKYEAWLAERQREREEDSLKL